MRDQDVYFLRPVGFPDGPIKIGFSWNIPLRMRTFAEWSPLPLEVLATGSGGRATENRLHQAFAAGRLHFEWFASTIRLRELIADVNATDLKTAMVKHGIPLLSPYNLRALRKNNVELSADAFLKERA